MMPDLPNPAAIEQHDQVACGIRLMDAGEEVHRARDRDDSVFDLVAEQTRQGKVAEVIGAHMSFEAVGGAGQRQTHHAGVVHQHINGFHRVGECTHAGESARSSWATSTSAGISAAAPTPLLPPVMIIRISVKRT